MCLYTVFICAAAAMPCFNNTQWQFSFFYMQKILIITYVGYKHIGKISINRNIQSSILFCFLLFLPRFRVFCVCDCACRIVDIKIQPPEFDDTACVLPSISQSWLGPRFLNLPYMYWLLKNNFAENPLKDFIFVCVGTYILHCFFLLEKKCKNYI